MSKVIRIKRVDESLGKYKAYIGSNPDCCSWGETPEEALGWLVKLFPEEFSVWQVIDMEKKENVQ